MGQGRAYWGLDSFSHLLLLCSHFFSLSASTGGHKHKETKIARWTSNQATPKPFPRLHQGWEEPGSPALGHTGVCYHFQISATQFYVFAFLTMTHPDIPILMVGFPISPCVAVEQAVLGHPVWAAVSSLGCYGTDLLSIAKVNLKPLIMVTVWWRPSSSTWIR